MACLGRFSWCCGRGMLALVVLYCWSVIGWGQDGSAIATPETVEAALHAMSDAAGVIFTGQVVAVRHRSDVVEVEFRVDQAVRGCSAGETYVLREWAGLWTGGDARYRIGQRLLMLLRTPGAGGMSSPVGGMDGAIPIRGVESVINGISINASAQSIAQSRKAEDRTSEAYVAGTVAAAAPVAVVDLRWIGARALRTVEGVAGNGLVTATTVGVPQGAGVASMAAEGASVDALVGLLGVWEAARAAR
ncbi:hypothetical protein BH10ACI4_BH10ACI4_35010 [soil metagenome]